VTSTHRAAIGAEVTTVLGSDGSPGGVGIVSVTSGGPADQAGLRAGDTITAVSSASTGSASTGSASTPDTSALSEALAGDEPGDQVTLKVTRGGQDLTVHITLGQLPAS
jgi:S1-C subfamily serine protease